MVRPLYLAWKGFSLGSSIYKVFWIWFFRQMEFISNQNQLTGTAPDWPAWTVLQKAFANDFRLKQIFVERSHYVSKQRFNEALVVLGFAPNLNGDVADNGPIISLIWESGRVCLTSSISDEDERLTIEFGNTIETCDDAETILNTAWALAKSLRSKVFLISYDEFTRPSFSIAPDGSYIMRCDNFPFDPYG